MSEKENGTPAKSNAESEASGGKATSPGDSRNKPSVKKSVEGFLCEVDALADALPVIMPLVTDSNTKAVREFESFLQNRCKKAAEGRWEVPTEEYTEFLNLKRRLDRNRRAI